MAVLRLGRRTSSCKLFPSCLFASLLSGQPVVQAAVRATQVEKMRESGQKIDCRKRSRLAA
ncbi:unnamed protein product, partial [Bubo scandiacus]